MFCKNCGNKLDDDALFCMNCGVKVSDDTSSRYCAHCGSEVESDAVFCVGCGKRIHEEQKEPKLENSLEPENTEEETVAESNLESAKEKEESEEAAPQNAEPIIVAEPAKSETENETVTAPVIDETLRGENHNEKENSELVVSQKEYDSEEKPNIEKDDANNGKGIRVAIGIISGIFVLVLAILIGVGSKYKNPWTASDELNLDILNAKTEIWTAPGVFNLDVLNAKTEIYTDNDGNKEAVNCYNISETDLEKLWNSISWNSKDVSLIYAGSTWDPFEPEYDKIEDYNESVQLLMRKYDIICSQVYHYDDGGLFVWTYLINRKTGQVMAF